MGRSVAWRNRCPEGVSACLQQVSTCGLLVVQQPGPTSFVLKDPQHNKKFKVSIGEVHQCSCRGSAEELCLHILFVLSRVFRLPHDNPMVWQRSLLAAEVDQLIRGHISQQTKKRGVVAHQTSDGKTAVPRRAVQPDDVCPICCDDIHEDRALVYCRYGCGNNLHASCFKQYATHNSTNPTPLLCPLCREPWGVLGDGPAHNLQCSDCHGPINGERYKCAFCTSYNLCASCFQCPMIHPQHPFDVSLGPSLPFQVASRPAAPSRPSGAPATSLLQGVAPADVHPWMLRELGPEDYEALLRLDDDLQPTGNNAVLSPEQAQALKKRPWHSEDPTMAACDTCAICLEAFRAGDIVNSLPLCQHFFHVPCAFRWLTECRGVCPVDNVPVPAAAFVRTPGASHAVASAPDARTSIRPARRLPAATAGPPATTSQRASSQRPRHRFEDANAEQRAVLNRRNPNASLSGYCPTERDLTLLVVGSTPATNVAPLGALRSAPTFGRAAAGGSGQPRQVPTLQVVGGSSRR